MKQGIQVYSKERQYHQEPPGASKDKDTITRNVE